MSDYMKFRGQCKKLSEAAVAADPTLTLVRGHYFCPIWNTEEQHWWTVRPDGTSRWATNEVQSNNRGCVVRLTFDGVTDTLSGWSKRTGISRSALHLRYYQGWSTERLLTQPQRKAPKAPI